jgi:S-adenosyl-L-methionine hydrolase (adenosine-forming)
VTRVVLLSDFGTIDGYAAAMAGVVATEAPDAIVEHATHDIPAGDVMAAALALYRYAALYPPGTVHIAVVDPGVGTARRALAATIDGRHFVSPDNGTLTFILRAAAQVSLVDASRIGRGDQEPAPTFHGRDIFAPAGAHLARGGPLEVLGPPVVDPVLLDIAQPERDGGEIRGEVVHVDRFGNLITNIDARSIHELATDGDAVQVRVGDVDAGPLRRTYGDVPTGGVVALVGSLDLLEVSIRDGDGARSLGAGRGSRVTVTAP